MSTDITDARQLDLTRAIRLGQLLRLRQRERGNTIRTITVRVSLETRDEDVLPTATPSPCAAGTMPRWPSSAIFALRLTERMRGG
jgi:hypothetical protein